MDRKTKQLIAKVITVVMWLFIARVLLSWVPALQGNPVSDLLLLITNPIILPLRSVIPPVGGFDLSVLIIFFGLSFIRRKLLS